MNTSWTQTRAIDLHHYLTTTKIYCSVFRVKLQIIYNIISNSYQEMHYQFTRQQVLREEKLLIRLHRALYSLFMGTKYKKKLLIILHRVLYSIFMETKYINIFLRGILFPITKRTVVLKIPRLGSIEIFTNVKV